MAPAIPALSVGVIVANTNMRLHLRIIQSRLPVSQSPGELERHSLHLQLPPPWSHLIVLERLNRRGWPRMQMTRDVKMANWSSLSVWLSLAASGNDASESLFAFTFGEGRHASLEGAGCLCCITNGRQHVCRHLVASFGRRAATATAPGHKTSQQI